MVGADCFLGCGQTLAGGTVMAIGTRILEVLFPRERLFIPKSHMPVLLSWNRRVERSTPWVKVDSAAGPVKGMKLVANGAEGKQSFVSTGHVIFEVTATSGKYGVKYAKAVGE
jgi:hypothetical protein